MLPRDIFINEIKKMEKDKDIYFLSADFGAAALDEIRVKFKKILFIAAYLNLQCLI